MERGRFQAGVARDSDRGAEKSVELRERKQRDFRERKVKMFVDRGRLVLGVLLVEVLGMAFGFVLGAMIR